MPKLFANGSNIYNDCIHQNSLTTIHLFMQHHSVSVLASESDHMMWCRDFNQHHPLWDEERNGHLLTAGASATVQPLIALLEDFNMVMLLPKGLLMLQSMVTKNWTRVDNVFAMHNTEHLVVTCDTDPRQWGPGTDHVPVLTTLDLEIPAAAAMSRRNFRAADWLKFRQTLMDQLDNIPGLRTLLNELQFQGAVSDLTTALQAAIEHVVPLSKPSLHSRRWWNDELSRLKKEMNHFASVSYRYRAVADHPSHSQYTDSEANMGLRSKGPRNGIGIRFWRNSVVTTCGQLSATRPAQQGMAVRPVYLC